MYGVLALNLYRHRVNRSDVYSTLLGSLSPLVIQVAPNVDVAPQVGVAGSAVGTFLTTLVVGAIMVALAPEYTERMMEAVADDPVGSFVYGIVGLLVLFVLIFVLVITLVGILIAIPVAIATYVLWAVGAVIAYLAIADRLIGHADGWLKPLLLAAGLNGLLTITGIGGLVSLAIGAAGFGTVLRLQLG